MVELQEYPTWNQICLFLICPFEQIDEIRQVLCRPCRLGLFKLSEIRRRFRRITDLKKGSLKRVVAVKQMFCFADTVSPDIFPRFLEDLFSECE